MVDETTFPGAIYAKPGVYTQQNFELPSNAPLSSVKLPVLIGTGNEILTQEDLEVIRGSSAFVDQRVVDEDETGRAVVEVDVTGVVTLGDFDGDLTRFQVLNFPIVSGNGSGTISNVTSSVEVRINNVPVVVVAVDGTKGVIEIVATPSATDEVRATYFFNRKDTQQTDDVSAQVSITAAEVLGSIGEPVGGYVLNSENNTLELTIDGELFPITLGVGSKSADTLTTLIQTQTFGSSLVPSTYTTNFQETAIRLRADREIIIGSGTANSVLGFTEGFATSRTNVFTTFNGPIVDGSNGGITTTDPADITVKVNNVQVLPSAVDGANRSVTLPFAPEPGAFVTIKYFYNTWQNTFDYLANDNVVDIVRCGVAPGDGTFTESVDFILKDDRIHWGTSFLVTPGEHTEGSAFFSDQQIRVSLVDNKAFLEPCTAVVDTTVNPPVESVTKFDLPFIPTTGNGRSTPLGLDLFNQVTNGRIDLPTNRPDLVKAYWGFNISDAVERGVVEVLAVEGTTITLKNPVQVGAKVFASFYYNTITDGEFTIKSVVTGGSGVGQYSITDSNQNDVLIPQFGVKSAGISVITVNFPSGSESKPDVRFENGTPLEETVTVTFAETAATLAKFTVRGSDDYFTIQDASDHARFLVDGASLAAGSSGIDLSRVNGVDGLGFPASVLGNEIVYDASTGLTTYDIEQDVNDKVSVTFDGILVEANVPANATATVQDYVDALNVDAKLSENAPVYTGSTRFLGTTAISVGVFDTLSIHYNGDVSSLTGPVIATIAPGSYTSPTLLADAVQTALDTAISSLPAIHNGLSVGVAADANGSLSFSLEGLPAADSAVPATGTATALGVPLGTTLALGGITLTGGDQQITGLLNFDVGRASGTALTNGVEPTTTLTVGAVTITASGGQTPGGLNFDEGSQATGTVTAASILPGDTVTIGGITLTAAGQQTPTGLDFDEGDQATGTITAASVEPGDTVTVDGTVLTASGSQTSGGLDFDEGDQATGSITAAAILPGDTVTVAGITLTALNAETGSNDFDEGDQATGTITTLGVVSGDTITVSGTVLTASGAQTSGGLNFDQGVQAFGTVLIPTPPLGGSEDITVNAFILTFNAGPRTPGSDDFDGSLGSDIAIATDIVAAINDGANSFSGLVTASNSGGTSPTVTITANTPGTAGNSITLASTGFTVSGATFSGGVGTDTTVAASIAAAVNDVANGISATATASPAAAVVTLTAVVPGTVGNAITLVSSNGTRLAVSAGTLLGGVGTDLTVAASIADAINNAGNGIFTSVTAIAVGAIANLTAVTPGAVGNTITLASSNPTRVAVSAATLLGGLGDDSTVTASLIAAINDAGNGITSITAVVNGILIDLTAVIPGMVGNSLTISSSNGTRLSLSGATLAGGAGTDTTVAASISAAVNAVGNGISVSVTATPAVAVVTLTAVTPGVAGNSISLASSDGFRIALSNPTLLGGIGDNTTVAASIVDAINDVGNGLSALVVAANLGTLVTITALTPGLAGNSIALSSSDPTKLPVSGSTLAGGLDDVGVASSIVAAILDSGNGLTPFVTADNAAGASAVVTITAATAGPSGNAITLVSSDGVALAVSGATLTGGENKDGGFLEFLDGASVAVDFAVLAGLSTDANPGDSQVKVLNCNVARRFTVTDTSGRLKYDRMILRGRIVPGSGSLSHYASLSQAGVLVEGSSGAGNAGLIAGQIGVAGTRAVVDPATQVGLIPVSNNQVPVATFSDARDGQVAVTFRAEGGTLTANDVFKITIDGIGVTVVFTDALGVAIPTGGSVDVPLGPVTVANTVLYQIRSASVAAGLAADSVSQEGAGTRLISQTSDSNSVVTIGEGSANADLGFAANATATRVGVPAGKIASALMAHSANSPANFYLEYVAPTATYFAAQALAGVITNSAGAEFLYLQSQANNVGGLGTSSSIVWEEPSTGNGSVLLPGTGLLTLTGEGASGEEALSGFYVISTDPNGSGSANDSIFNDGVGQDGFVGQTYHDDSTGLTFAVLDRDGGGNYPVDENFTYTVKKVVSTDANLPTNAISGTETVVSNTLNVPPDDTAILNTFRKDGAEPANGDFYYVTYDFQKSTFVNGTTPTIIFTQTREIAREFGVVSPDNPLSLGGALCKQNGAINVGLKQVEKDEGANTASIDKYAQAIDELNGSLPGGNKLQIITPLPVGATVAEQTDLLIFAGQQAKIQSSLRFRAERTVIAGTSNMKPSQVKVMANTLSNARVRVMYPDVVSLTFRDPLGNEQQSLVDGYFAAAAWDGFLASNDSDPATPWTNRRIIGFDTIARDLKEVDKNNIASSGVTIFEESSGGSAFNIRDGLTTEISHNLLKLPTVITIADEVNRRARATLSRYIGVKFLLRLLPQIEASLTNVLKGLVAAEIITAFTGVRARVDPKNPTTVLVEAFFSPVFPLKYIVIKFGIASSL